MFNQFFQNPYARFLPPEMQQALNAQSMGNLGTALLQNSYTNKSGMAAFGDALAQFRQGQKTDAGGLMEMQALAERMRLAQAQNERAWGQYRGEDAASQRADRDFEEDQRRYDSISPYQQGQLDIQRRRNEILGQQRGGLFPGAGGAKTEEQVRAEVEKKIQQGLPLTPEEYQYAPKPPAPDDPKTPDAQPDAPPDVTPRALRPGVRLTSQNQQLVREYAMELKRAGQRAGITSRRFDELDNKIRQALPDEVVRWIEQNPDKALSDPTSALYN